MPPDRLSPGRSLPPRGVGGGRPFLHSPKATVGGASPHPLDPFGTTPTPFQPFPGDTAGASFASGPTLYLQRRFPLPIFTAKYRESPLSRGPACEAVFPTCVRWTVKSARGTARPLGCQLWRRAPTHPPPQESFRPPASIRWRRFEELRCRARLQLHPLGPAALTQGPRQGAPPWWTRHRLVRHRLRGALESPAPPFASCVTSGKSPPQAHFSTWKVGTIIGTSGFYYKVVFKGLRA